MPLLIAETLLSILCIAHVIRTGRDQSWIWLILIPGIGAPAYFLAEIVPSVIDGRGLGAVDAGLARVIDPHRALRQAERAMDLADTVDNRRALAEALIGAGRAGEAITLLEGLTAGNYADDPAVIGPLAQAYFQIDQPSRTLDVLRKWQEANPQTQVDTLKLLEGEALVALGRDQEAIRLFREMVEGYPGEEPRCKLGILLMRNGSQAEARRLFEEVVRRVGQGDRHYKRREGGWAKLARDYL